MKQLEMYTPPEPTADEKLSAAQAEMRLEQMAREATKPGATDRDRRRSRRRHAVRAKTISVKRMTKRELELGRLLYPDVEDVERPAKREDCLAGGVNEERPCPFVSCPHHLYLDVASRTGAIKMNRPDLEVWEMPETCSLDVADRGGTTLEEVGALMNVTRERVRQVEVKGLAKLQAAKDMQKLRDFVDGGPAGKRRLPVLEQREETEDESEPEDFEDSEFEGEFDAEHFASAALDSE